MIIPPLEEFLNLAGQGNLIPVTSRILADIETPLSAYRKIRGQGESFLFESVEGGEHLGRYSFVGCNPRAVIRQTGNRVEVIEDGKVVETFEVKMVGRAVLCPPSGDDEARRARSDAPYQVKDGLEVVERVMKKYRARHVARACRASPAARWVSSATNSSTTLNRSCRARHTTNSARPRCISSSPINCSMFDRVAQTITVLVNAAIDEAASPTEAYEDAVDEIERLVSLLEQPSEHHPVSVPSEVPPLPFESNVAEGKISRQCRCRRRNSSPPATSSRSSARSVFSAETKASPVDVYRAARSVNPSPYMFLLELDGFSLVGASPEIHVRCEDNKVEIRPIAGTRRRGKTAEEDAALEKELLADPKERAEHVMLVDLARNDIGRVCDFGSVQVKDLMIIERYSHVMHIVSQRRGQVVRRQNQLRPDARDVSGGHGERRAEDSRHADHLRTRRHDARAVWRLRGLL